MRTRSLTAIFAAITSALASCSNEPGQETKSFEGKTDTARKPRVGDVRDAHGCLSSGGYVWSAAKDSCIRLWESGAVLEPTDRSEMIVYAVESGDKMKAEIFVPDDSTILLEGDGQGNYKNDSFSLSSAGEKYALAKNGQIIYRTGVPGETQVPERKIRRKRR